jgi:hypothetical protein
VGEFGDDTLMAVARHHEGVRMSQYPSGMRASDADRERTADVLKAAVAEGRLRPEEYEHRLGAALSAHTYGELDRLVADLPAGPSGAVGQALAPVPTGPWAGGLPPPPIHTNGLAIGALIASITGIFTAGLGAILGVILGHVARAQIRQTGEAGDGLAVAGLIIGYCQVALGALFVLVMILAVALSGG